MEVVEGLSRQREMKSRVNDEEAGYEESRPVSNGLALVVAQPEDQEHERDVERDEYLCSVLRGQVPQHEEETPLLVRDRIQLMRDEE